MMTENKRVEEQRARLNNDLEKIVQAYRRIDQELAAEKHSRGTAHRSLKPKSGAYVAHHEKGITATYQGTDGSAYEVIIRKKDEA